MKAKGLSGSKQGVGVAQPNAWFTAGMWRRLFKGEEEQARDLRLALADLMVYPFHPLTLANCPAVSVANHRAALHQVVDELDATEAHVLFNVGRLLLLVPRRREVFRHIRERQEALIPGPSPKDWEKGGAPK